MKHQFWTVMKFDIENGICLGISHSGAVMTEGTGILELYDNEVSLLINIKEKKIVTWLNLESKSRILIYMRDGVRLIMIWLTKQKNCIGYDYFIVVSSVLCVLVQTVLAFYISYPDL